MTTEVCFHRCATFHKSRTMSNDPCHRHRLLSKMESANEVGKMRPPSQTQFPSLVVCSMLGGGRGHTEPGVGVPLSCTTAVPCATLFSGLGRGTQSKNTGTLLRAAEGRLILTKYYLVRALHALYTRSIIRATVVCLVTRCT